MANPFCLIPTHATALLNAIQSGALDPIALSRASSDVRRAAFENVVGKKNAEALNAAFESKLLLKNQQAGIIKWITESTQPGSAIRRDLLARVERMDPRILNPAQLNAFLADLAKKKLGFGVTMAETAKITSLAQDIETAKAAGNWDAFMDARVAFSEYTAELKGRGPMTIPKAIVAGVRASVLTGFTIFEKLAAAALGRSVTTRAEDVIAMGTRKVLPALAKGSGRYDVPASVALKAEAASSAAAWTDGLIDAGRLLKNKAARLDLMHNMDATAHAWYEYSGSLHAAMKSTTKWAEYAKSLYRRTAEAQARGENVNDFTVKLRLSTEAYKDGNRAISMQDNIVSKGFSALTRRMEQVDPETGKANPAGVVISTALKTDMPVTRVANNIVAEASDYIGGLLKGPTKAAWAYYKGIEDLKPVERDMIIRQISKGSVGAAIMALAYFKHDQIQFGGFYEKGEKRKPGDVPVGGLRINGVDVPKELLHLPVFEAAQFAATAGKVYGTKLHKKDEDPQGAMSALSAGAIGLVDEVPLWGSLSSDIGKLSDPYQRGEVLPTRAANFLVPGAVSWVARKTDPAPADAVKRNPKGFVQHVEANIPGLREKVPLKKR